MQETENTIAEFDAWKVAQRRRRIAAEIAQLLKAI